MRGWRHKQSFRSYRDKRGWCNTSRSIEGSSIHAASKHNHSAPPAGSLRRASASVVWLANSNTCVAASGVATQPANAGRGKGVETGSPLSRNNREEVGENTGAQGLAHTPIKYQHLFKLFNHYHKKDFKAGFEHSGRGFDRGAALQQPKIHHE